MSIIIDKEFENLIPPLTADEFSQLEENCVKDGIREPLVVWKQDDGNSILIDGHNRFKIIAKHMLHYTEIWKQFKNRDEAKAWIIRNQFGRRNLSAYDRSVLALKLKPLIAEKAKENQVRTTENRVSQKSDEQKVSTKDALAKIAGVSHDTIHKVEAIEKKATPETKQQVREGKLSINQAYNAVTNKTPKRAKEEYLDELKERHESFGEKKKEKAVSLTEAMQDKEDRKTLAIVLWNKMIRMGNQIDAIHAEIRCGDYDAKNMMANISEDEAEQLKTALLRWEKKLRELHTEVTSK